MKQVYFLSQWKAEKLEPEPGQAIISVTCPGEPASLNPNWTHIHRVFCHDIDMVSPPFIPFDKLMAKALIGFVEAIKDQVEVIIVHCQAGISRSAAISQFLSDFYGFSLSKVSVNGHSQATNLMNSLVYHTLKKTYTQLNSPPGDGSDIF